MAGGYKIPVFVSSAHYGLEDLRAELASFLEQLGTSPLVSSEQGFPEYAGMPPYASCLKVLENCLLVVGVIDRRYGGTFDDWGPYPQYKALSPTHGELRHALSLNKRLLVYVRSSVASYYDVYRKNREQFGALQLPEKLDPSTMVLFEELKKHDPAPWIEEFRDVRDIKASIQSRLVNYLYDAFTQQESMLRAGTKEFVATFLKEDPKLRREVMASIDATLASDLQSMEARVEQLQRENSELKQSTPKAENLRAQLDQAIREKAQLERAFLEAVMPVLTAAADPSFVARRTASPTLLPVVSDMELARAGIWFSGYSQSQPEVHRASWSRFSRTSPGGSRGYDAAYQIFGKNFAPGCRIEWEDRRNASRSSNLTNLWSGHYLELSTNSLEEMAINSLRYRFRVINPWLQNPSNWVDFSYAIDREVELRKAETILADGLQALSEKDYVKASRLLHSAELRFDGLLEMDDPKTKQARDGHQTAATELARQRSSRA